MQLLGVLYAHMFPCVPLHTCVGSICPRVCICSDGDGSCYRVLQCGVRVFKLGGLFFPNLSPPLPPKSRAEMKGGKWSEKKRKMERGGKKKKRKIGQEIKREG